MRPGDSDELLSAYLDREVTPAEREQVEARLDASPDTRAELDAIAELSLCLRTLNRPEAPTDFQASVMQALAGRRVAPVPASQSSVRRSRREWIVTIAALVTTACGLFLAVSSWNSGGLLSPQKPATSFSVSMSEGTHPTTPAAFDSLANAGGPRPVVEMTLSESVNLSDAESRHRAVLEATGDLKRRSKLPLPMSAPIATNGTHPSDSPSAADGVRVVERESTTPDGNALEKVALNDVLNAWASTDVSDRYVANIDLQVRDVRRTADGFIVLLSNNGVVTVPLNQATMAKQSGEDKTDALSAANRPAGEKQPVDEMAEVPSTIGVYVDSTPEIVTKSLDELAQKYDVVGLRLLTPLALSRAAEDTSPMVGKEAKDSSRTQLSTLDDITYAYKTQQLGMAPEWTDADGPVDALFALDPARVNEAGTKTAELQQRKLNYGNRTAPEAPAPANTKMLFADKNDVAAANGANANTALFFCSEVRLPLGNNLEGLANSTIAANSATAIDSTFNRAALKSNSTPPATPALQQNQVSTNNFNQRYRQNANRDGTNANPVRVLVVFQDAPVAMKAKAAGKP